MGPLCLAQVRSRNALWAVLSLPISLAIPLIVKTAVPKHTSETRAPNQTARVSFEAGGLQAGELHAGELQASELQAIEIPSF